MFQKLKTRVERTVIWKWGQGTSKNGWNAVAYLILFLFAGYGQLLTLQVSHDSASQATEAAKFVADVTTRLDGLVYEIQLSDYEGCLRAVANQASVKDFNNFLLNRALELGVAKADIDVLFTKNEELFISPATCEQPPPRTVPLPPGD